MTAGAASVAVFDATSSVDLKSAIQSLAVDASTASVGVYTVGSRGFAWKVENS